MFNECKWFTILIIILTKKWNTIQLNLQKNKEYNQFNQKKRHHYIRQDEAMWGAGGTWWRVVMMQMMMVIGHLYSVFMASPSGWMRVADEFALDAKATLTEGEARPRRLHARATTTVGDDWFWLVCDVVRLTVLQVLKRTVVTATTMTKARSERRRL